MENNFNDRIARILAGAGLSTKNVDVVTSSPLGGTNTSFICSDRSKGDKYVLRLAAGSSAAIGINRMVEYAALHEASLIGCGAPVYYFDPESGDMLTGFIEGKTLSPEDFTRENISAFAGVMKRLHSRRTEYKFDPAADVERRLEVIAANKIPLRTGFDLNYAFYKNIAE